MEMDEKALKRISGALYGIEASSEWPTFPERMYSLHRQTRPPSYIIQLVLEHLYQRRLPRGIQKSAWELPVSFDGADWIVGDWKNYAWNLASPSGTKEQREKLVKKLTAAGKIVDSHLSRLAETERKEGRISLENQYQSTKMMFEYHRERLQTAVEKAKPDMIVGEPGPERTALVHEYYRYRREASNGLISTSIFFFALTEIIFDACYAIGDRNGITYAEFRSLDWPQRFKWLYTQPWGKEKTKLYEQLVFAKKYYRNIPVHSSPRFFYRVEGVGLVPSSYAEMDKPSVSDGNSFETDIAKKYLEVFDEFFRQIKTDPASKHGFMYAESELALYIDEELVRDLKNHMTSTESFREELDKRIEIMYRHINGEM